MAISVYKTFSAGEVLTASDLNASLTQIVNNGTDVAFPLTKNSSLGGFSLFTDAANTKSFTDSTKGLSLVLTAFNDAKTTVASAATPDIWTGTGKLIDYTGTVTATGFASAAQAGSSRSLLCAGAAVFTAGANMLIDGYASGTNFTAAAGDVVDVIAVTTTQFRLKPRLYTGGAVFIDNKINDFRLTLTTAVPLTTGDVTGATTLYASPYCGNKIALFDGTNWNMRVSAEFSLALGTLTSGKPYDVFCYDNSGVPTLEFLVWTNDTTRATALVLQDGVWSKTGALTRRYLGTFYTTSTTQTEDSYANRYLYNYYNRCRRPMRVTEATDSWAYTTATIRQARATATNQVAFVIGVDEDPVYAEIAVSVRNTNASVYLAVGIGLDSTSTFTTGGIFPGAFTLITNLDVQPRASLRTFAGVGRHFMSWNEYSTASGTTTWFGDNGSPTLNQSGITGEIMG